MTTLPTTPAQPLVSIAGLNHWFGRGDQRRQVLHDLHLTLNPGEMVLLSGPSGCGKTTLLTLIGALRTVQAGSVEVLGEQLLKARKSVQQRVRRRMGIIFQQHNLLRCLTAAQNVQMGADLVPGLSFRQRANAPSTCWWKSAWRTITASCLPPCRGGSVSGWPLPAPCREIPGCSWRTNPPPPWIAAQAGRWWSF